MIASIVDEVQQFSSREQHDDITLIVVRCQRDSRRLSGGV